MNDLSLKCIESFYEFCPSDRALLVISYILIFLLGWLLGDHFFKDKQIKLL